MSPTSTAVVTGGGHGIGRAIALQLADAGCNVVVHYAHSVDAADDVREEIERRGKSAWTVQADLTEPGEENKLATLLTEVADGKLEVLVNNAGHLVQRQAIEHMDDDLWHHIVEVNLSSAFRASRALIPLLRANGGGAIVNVSSLAAHNGGGMNSVAYSAAKAGMLGLTRGLAKELAPDGIRVNAVAPGFIGQTKFHDTFTPADTRSKVVEAIPLRREGTPDDVASAVTYLVGSGAGFVTGETIDITGGAWFR